MGKTFAHIIEAKFRQGILKLSEIPRDILQKWKRHNFDRGEYKALRKQKLEKILKDEQERFT